MILSLTALELCLAFFQKGVHALHAVIGAKAERKTARFSVHAGAQVGLDAVVHCHGQAGRGGDLGDACSIESESNTAIFPIMFSASGRETAADNM